MSAKVTRKTKPISVVKARQKQLASIPPSQRGSSAMTKPTPTRAKGTVATDAAAILFDLRELINSARRRVATVANAEQTLLYWRLGKRILTENLTEGRAEYGKRILATLSQELVAEFGEGFSLRNLYRAAQFCQAFPDEQIVSTLSAQLGWSHFVEILPIKDPLARDFYAEVCRVERWKQDAPYMANSNTK